MRSDLRRMRLAACRPPSPSPRRHARCSLRGAEHNSRSIATPATPCSHRPCCEGPASCRPSSPSGWPSGSQGRPRRPPKPSGSRAARSSATPRGCSSSPAGSASGCDTSAPTTTPTTMPRSCVPSCASADRWRSGRSPATTRIRSSMTRRRRPAPRRARRLRARGARRRLRRSVRVRNLAPVPGAVLGRRAPGRVLRARRRGHGVCHDRREARPARGRAAARAARGIGARMSPTPKHASRRAGRVGDRAGSPGTRPPRLGTRRGSRP